MGGLLLASFGGLRCGGVVVGSVSLIDGDDMPCTGTYTDRDD